jgi:hypothetical protein
MTESQGGSRPIDPLEPDVVGTAPSSPIAADPRLDRPPTGRPDNWEAAESSGQDSTAATAKDQAGQVKDDAMAGGQHVAGVAKSEARNVTAEAGQQAKHLWQQTRSELTDQAEHQQQRLAASLRDFGSQLGSMAESSDANGVATDLVRQGSTKAHAIAQWLEGRDPAMVMEDVRAFARRKPGVFLAAAAALGFAAARMGRGVQAEHQDQNTSTPAEGGPGADVYPVPRAVGSVSAGEQLP